jgi:hypothetical protein
VPYPGGRTVNRPMVFDGSKYVYTFETGTVGQYRVRFTYNAASGEYNHSTLVEVAYLPEYDMFAGAERYNVYRFMRDNGETVEDAIPNMENDPSMITKYKESFIVPLLIAASVIFLADVSVRKLRKSKKTGAGAR